MSSKKGKPNVNDKQAKDVTASRPSTSSTSPSRVERMRSHAPAPPRACERHLEDQESGLPCPISVSGTEESSSTPEPPQPVPPVSRAPNAVNLAQGIYGQTSPWVVPPNQPGSYFFPGLQWNLPQAGMNPRGQHSYNMVAPTSMMPPQFWPPSWYNAPQQWPTNVAQQHQVNPATPGQLSLPPASVSPIGFGVIPGNRDNFGSTSDTVTDGGIKLSGDTDGTYLLDPGEFLNPHRKSVGTPVTEKVLQWWEELRSNKLAHEDFKEEMQANQVPMEQEKYFKAPELPIQESRNHPSKKLVRLGSQDDKLKDSHNHLLKVALPLTHLFDALVDPSCPESVDASLVLQHVTSALIMLGSASQSLALSRQHAFDDLLDRRFDSIKRISPSMGALFGGNLTKDIEEAEKASKLAAKVTKTGGTMATSFKGTKFSPYYLAMTRKFRGKRSFQYQGRQDSTYKSKYGAQKFAAPNRGRFHADRGSDDSKTKK